MKHLSVDEILDFVTLTEPNAEAVALCASVTRHIRCCGACRKKVRAFLDLHDAFLRLGNSGDFRSFASGAADFESEAENELDVQQ